MRIIFILALSLSVATTIPAQDLESIMDGFLNKTELKHATVGFSLLNEDGETLVENNSEKSLSPASTQKLLTSITALEVLGHDHRFVTTLSLQGTIKDGVLLGNIIVKSGGDPTLGSEDFKLHYGDFVQDWINALSEKGIKKVEGRLLIDDSIFTGDRHAGSSALNDVGNYYGAGAPGFSLMDNEFQVYFNTKGIGSTSEVGKVEPELPEGTQYINTVKAGTVKGDNVIIYSLDNSTEIFLKGQLPSNKSAFKVRGAIPDMKAFGEYHFTKKFAEGGINISGEVRTGPLFMNTQELHRTKSPELIEIVKVLTKKSVNTYADVLLKHIGLAKGKAGSFSEGAKAIKAHWTSKGLNTDGITIEDGSGLARRNNLTSAFLTQVLSSVSSDEQVNKMMNECTGSGSIKSLWGGEPAGFIQAKSGYIGGVRAYGGYLIKDGKKYPFHIMVNNYHGSSSKVRKLIGVFLKECMAGI